LLLLPRELARTLASTVVVCSVFYAHSSMPKSISSLEGTVHRMGRGAGDFKLWKNLVEMQTRQLETSYK